MLIKRIKYTFIGSKFLINYIENNLLKPTFYSIAFVIISLCLPVIALLLYRYRFPRDCLVSNTLYLDCFFFLFSLLSYTMADSAFFFIFVLPMIYDQFFIYSYVKGIIIWKKHNNLKILVYWTPAHGRVIQRESSTIIWFWRPISV